MPARRPLGLLVLALLSLTLIVAPSASGLDAAGEGQGWLFDAACASPDETFSSGLRLSWTQTCWSEVAPEAAEGGSPAPAPAGAGEPPTEFTYGSYDNENGYAYPGYGFDSATAEAVSPDGKRVFVTGVSWRGPGHMNHDWVTVAFDQSGRSRWMQSEDGVFNHMDAPADIALTPDGQLVLVTGSIDFRISNAYAGDFRTVAYRTDTGARVWSTSFDGPGEGDCLDVPTAMAISPDGRFAYVTGESQTSPDDDMTRTFSTVAYDVATGEEVWQNRLQESGVGYRPLNIATSPDGRQVYVSGRTGDATGDASIVTVAYRGGADESSGAGTILWKKVEGGVSRVGGTELSIDGDMEVSPKGDSVYLLGRSTAADGTRSAVTVAYDALTGSRRFSVSYTPTDPYSSVQPRALAISPDGATVYALSHSVISVASGVGSEDNWDFTTIAYNAASGQRQWTSQVDIEDTDTAFDIAVLPGKDQVILTGRTGGANYSLWGWDAQPPYVRAGHGQRAATVTLNSSTGETVWTDTFDGYVQDSDWPSYLQTAVPHLETIWRTTQVATSADGTKVYVLGSFSRNTTGDAVKWILGFNGGVDLQEANTMDYMVLVYTFA